jgi:hypothetical protein
MERTSSGRRPVPHPVVQDGSEPVTGPSATARPSRLPVNSGNPQIAVAFPFSSITISRQDPVVEALVEIVHQLAEHTAVLARELDTDEAEELEVLVDKVAALAGTLKGH